MNGRACIPPIKTPQVPFHEEVRNFSTQLCAVYYLAPSVLIIDQELEVIKYSVLERVRSAL